MKVKYELVHGLWERFFAYEGEYALAMTLLEDR